MLSGFAEDDVLDLYRTMLLVRRFQEGASQLYRDGEVPGFVRAPSLEEGYVPDAERILASIIELGRL